MWFNFVCIGNSGVCVCVCSRPCYFGKYQLIFQLKLCLLHMKKQRKRRTLCQKQNEKKEIKETYLKCSRNLGGLCILHRKDFLSSDCQTIEARKLRMHTPNFYFFRKKNSCAPMSVIWLQTIKSLCKTGIWVFLNLWLEQALTLGPQWYSPKFSFSFLTVEMKSGDNHVPFWFYCVADK